MLQTGFLTVETGETVSNKLPQIWCNKNHLLFPDWKCPLGCTSRNSLIFFPSHCFSDTSTFNTLARTTAHTTTKGRLSGRAHHYSLHKFRKCLPSDGCCPYMSVGKSVHAFFPTANIENETKRLLPWPHQALIQLHSMSQITSASFWQCWPWVAPLCSSRKCFEWSDNCHVT